MYVNVSKIAGWVANSVDPDQMARSGPEVLMLNSCPTQSAKHEIFFANKYEIVYLLADIFMIRCV